MGGLSILNRRKRGILTMELMLVLPVLLIVLLALVELGTYLLAAQAIQGAAMAGTGRRPCPVQPTIASASAVVGALAGWSYAAALGPDEIQIVDSPAEGSVSVSVSVDATQAAVNPLAMVPGLDLTGQADHRPVRDA